MVAYLCVGTLWTYPRSFTKHTLHLEFELVSIYLHYIYLSHSALCVLESYELQNPKVLSIPAVLVKSGSSGVANPEVSGSADSEFNPLLLSENL